MKSSPQRPGRSLFLVFICAAYGAIFMAPLLVNALEPGRLNPSASLAAKGGSASAGTSGASQAREGGQRSFEECDRNKDGFLDKSEAGAVPGLSANFESADTNRDGRLDPAEFDNALTHLNLNK